tara:strand:- start:402 stop:542 length:141 start_codon:yes stop_codon:yes gene_type:complete
MESMRNAINAGNLGKFREQFLSGYSPPDELTRKLQKERWLNSLRRS